MLKQSILLGVTTILITLNHGEAEARGPFDRVGAAAQKLAVQYRMRPGSRRATARKVPLRRRVATANPSRTALRAPTPKNSTQLNPVMKCTDDGRLCLKCYYRNGVLIYCDIYHLPELQRSMTLMQR